MHNSSAIIICCRLYSSVPTGLWCFVCRMHTNIRLMDSSPSGLPAKVCSRIVHLSVIELGLNSIIQWTNEPMYTSMLYYSNTLPGLWLSVHHMHTHNIRLYGHLSIRTTCQLCSRSVPPSVLELGLNYITQWPNDIEPWYTVDYNSTTLPGLWLFVRCMHTHNFGVYGLLSIRSTC